ncbi:MAG: hypothetical protein ACREIL_07440, partial [Nitrospiraceae bacterium]
LRLKDQVVRGDLLIVVLQAHTSGNKLEPIRKRHTLKRPDTEPRLLSLTHRDAGIRLGLELAPVNDARIIGHERTDGRGGFRVEGQIKDDQEAKERMERPPRLGSDLSPRPCQWHSRSLRILFLAILIILQGV